MLKETLIRLRDLRNRAIDNHVLGNGSATIVIYAAELHAIEEAIEGLERK